MAHQFVGHRARLDVPGQRTRHGTRNAPSQLVFFSERNGVIAPSGQVFMCGPLSVLVDDDRIVGDAHVVQRLEQCADGVVVLDHAVDVFAVAMRVAAAMLRRGRACAGACACR